MPHKIKKQKCFWMDKNKRCLRSLDTGEGIKCPHIKALKKCPYWRHPDWKIKF